MELAHPVPLLEQIHGCTFASLSARTVTKGVIRVVSGEQVILFRMKEGSGYENKVNRELRKLGRDPSFRVGRLPWGERVADLPLITHNGNYYLQTIPIKQGETHYFIGAMEVPRPSWLDRPVGGQGLPPGHGVLVQAYNIDNITKLKLKGETL